MLLHELAVGSMVTSDPETLASIGRRASTPVSFSLKTLALQFELLEIFHLILVRLRLLWELTILGSFLLWASLLSSYSQSESKLTKDKSNGPVLFPFSLSVSKAICSQLYLWRLSNGLKWLTPKLTGKVLRSVTSQKTINASPYQPGGTATDLGWWLSLARCRLCKTKRESGSVFSSSQFWFVRLTWKLTRILRSKQWRGRPAAQFIMSSDFSHRDPGEANVPF